MKENGSIHTYLVFAGKNGNSEIYAIQSTLLKDSAYWNRTLGEPFKRIIEITPEIAALLSAIGYIPYPSNIALNNLRKDILMDLSEERKSFFSAIGYDIFKKHSTHL